MSLIVKFYDVEHGSCTHIITPNGKHYLVDIGTKSTKSISRHLKHNYFLEGYHRSAEGKHPKCGRIKKRTRWCLQCANMIRSLKKKRSSCLTKSA